MIRVKTLALLAAIATSAYTADLTITIKDVRNSDGAVLLAVYDSEAHFMKPPLATTSRRVAAAKGDVTVVLQDLPAGKYAIASFHDENGNGKLDTNSFGQPTEGHGFSNGARGSMGPPSFTEAAFEFDGKTSKAIAFSLNY